jgi:DNA-binding NtrC family response regulator
MASKQVLISWIGHADLAAMCLDLPESKRRVVHAAVKLPSKEAERPGPLKTALENQTFAETHLLTNFPPEVNRLCLEWLGNEVAIHETTLAGPADYSSVFQETDRVLRGLWGRFRKARLEPCILLSPGTPTMATILVLLGKSRYPSTFYQTFKGKLQRTDIPYDLVDDFVPELLRGADLNLQHLSAKSPGQVEGFKDIVGDSQAIRLAVGRAQRAALRDVPVLILGESGTGKEMFASAIHEASHRRSGPFEAINCAAIPRELLESELFGHEKGSFTGAVAKRAGAFARANGGTLFLDEIGDCDLAMQAKLLRVLQPPKDKGPCHREFNPVGAEKPLTANVRVIAATNRDLVKNCRENRFREDLYYRLAVISLHLPPLRERTKDVPLIADNLLCRINEQFRDQDHAEPGYRDKQLSAAAMVFVKNYPWPGNVRQLHNALLQAAVMADADIIDRGDIAAAVGNLDAAGSGNASDHPLGDGFDLEEHLESIQRHYLRRAMQESRGVKAEAARLLGYKNYQTLAAQLERLGVKEQISPRRTQRAQRKAIE